MADKNAAAAVMKPATRAYVTLLANDGADDDSFKGVVGLAKGLRNTGSAYPLVVAVLPTCRSPAAASSWMSWGCVVREVQPVYPPHYNKLRVWEFVEYDQMMYLDAGFQGSLENIHEKFEPNHGPPPAPYVDAEMFVYKPSMATARLLLHMLAVMMRPRTTIADHVMVWPRISIADHVMMRPRTTIADHQQAAASSSRQFSNSLTTAKLPKQVMKVFFMAAVAVVTIYLHYY